MSNVWGYNIERVNLYDQDTGLACGHDSSDSCDCWCPKCDERLSTDPHMNAPCEKCAEEEE